jgi:hypothetical protein
MNLIPLHDGRPGLRTLLAVETRAPLLSDTSLPSVESPVLDFIASTDALDRYHEIIDPAGWHLDSYRRNPVFQNAHQYGDILFTLGKALITEVRPAAPKRSEGGSVLNIPHLFQRIQFATEVNPMARIAYGLYKGAFLNAVSVGFIPIRWEDGAAVAAGVPPAVAGGVPPPGPGRRGGSPISLPLTHPIAEGRSESTAACRQLRRKYIEQELLEVSAVAIPANPEALALGLKSGAVEKSDLRDTLELLKSLCAHNGAGRPPEPVRRRARPERPAGSFSNLQPAAGEPQLLAFARELRRILRRS